MHFLSLQSKDVINICTGRRIGYVSDIILDESCLRLEALVVEGNAWMRLICFFKAPSSYVVPMACVRSIGEDVILVDIEE